MVDEEWWDVAGKRDGLRGMHGNIGRTGGLQDGCITWEVGSALHFRPAGVRLAVCVALLRASETSGDVMLVVTLILEIDGINSSTLWKTMISKCFGRALYRVSMNCPQYLHVGSMPKR